MASELYDRFKNYLSQATEIEELKNIPGLDTLKEKSSEAYCSFISKWKDKLIEELEERDRELEKRDMELEKRQAKLEERQAKLEEKNEKIRELKEQQKNLSTCMNCKTQFSLDNQPFNLECTHVLCSLCYLNRGNIYDNLSLKESSPFQIQLGYCPLCNTLKNGIHFQYGLLASPQKLSKPKLSPRMTRAQSQLIQQGIQKKMAEDPSFVDQLKGIIPSYLSYSKFGYKKSQKIKKSHKKSKKSHKKNKKL